jgi:uncharacterized protein YecE (DUF72 family)
MQVWIGTSGYSYPDWVGDFYPPGTRPNAMLGYYTRHFPLVELNYTFYRPPTPSALAALADRTPDGFQFLVKIPQTISHERRPDDVPGFRLACAEVARRGKLLGVLCQLPQSFHHGRLGLDWLASLAEVLDGLRPAVEFRHRSWARPEIPEWLGQRGLDLVAVDVPELSGLYPCGWVQSGRRAYVRFHSRVAGNWYTGDKDRYDYDYTYEELAGWVDAASAAAAVTDEGLFLFNNCHRSQAVLSARRLAELFAYRASGQRVIAPFGPAAPEQKTLFD